MSADRLAASAGDVFRSVYLADLKHLDLSGVRAALAAGLALLPGTQHARLVVRTPSSFFARWTVRFWRRAGEPTRFFVHDLHARTAVSLVLHRFSDGSWVMSDTETRFARGALSGDGLFEDVLDAAERCVRAKLKANVQRYMSGTRPPVN